MPFLENLDKQKKANAMVALVAIASAVVISIMSLVMAFNFADNASSTIYVLNRDTPLVAARTRQDVTVDIEAKAHINLFHSLMYTLPPDNDFINENLEKAMYLVDESGLEQMNAMKERGFYSQIITASANFSIMTDSIAFNEEDMSFIYYGTQRIERRSSLVYRVLITEGNIQSTTRTENNPHGMIITNYRTVKNDEVEYKAKTVF
nr:conjugative transposon protein TraK [Clostridia bacterium]